MADATRAAPECGCCRLIWHDHQQGTVCGCGLVNDWRCPECGCWWCSLCGEWMDPYSGGPPTLCFICAADLW